MKLGVLSSTLLLLPQALAHGAIVNYTIDGKDFPGYKGFQPASSPPTIQRQWRDYDPSKDINDPKLRCHGGTSAQLSAQVSAGSTIVARWDYWPHYQGPVIVWLYKCASSFSSCDGSGKKWFKINQVGMLSPPLNGKNWGQTRIVNDKKWTVKIPALPAECAQLNVVSAGGGSASGPAAQYMVEIPGYASMKHPGLKIDIYTSKETKYEIPGPPVWPGQ